MELTAAEIERLAVSFEEDAERVNPVDGHAYYGPDERLARRQTAKRLRSGQSFRTIAAELATFDKQLALDLNELAEDYGQ